MPWFVYILKCSNNSYYVGHTENIEARLKLHISGKGAKHTAKHRPVTLIYHETADSKAAAMIREQQIKHWSKAKKEALINGDHLSLKALSRCRSLHGQVK
jgi:predicted GIY-YIG superfamily endonuclease